MKNSKNIAIFTTDLYHGGVAESTRKLVEVLSKDNHVDLIVYDNTPVKIKTKASREIFLNLPLAANFAKTSYGKLAKIVLRPFAMIFAILYLTYYRIKYKPDVIYSMMYIPNLVNLISASIFKGITKIIISERQDPRMDLNPNKLLTKLLRYYYRKADLIHANSLGMIDAISEFYNVQRDKIYHLDNFFFLDEVREQAKIKIHQRYEHIFEKKVIVTSGRLSKQKGHWHLLYALKKLIDNGDNYNLLILGDGELKSNLKDISEKLGIVDNVFLIGNVDNPHNFIYRSNVFIFPSIWESFGNSIVEAMALSKPIISTVCKSGPGYIIGNGKYGISLGVLPSYDEGFSTIHTEKIVSAIKSLENESTYEDLAKLALLRSFDFDSQRVIEKIKRLF